MRILLGGLAFVMPSAVAAMSIGAEWCIAKPVHGDAAVQRALEIAAMEVQQDIKESLGITLPVVPSGEAGSHAIWFGKEPAEKAGLDVSGFTAWDNAYAEKDGNLYFYGNDRPGRKALKPKELHLALFPSARAASRFLRDCCNVRFVMPGRVGTEVPPIGGIEIPDGTLSRERPSQRYGNYQMVNPDTMMHAIANGFFTPGNFFTYGGHTYPNACPPERYFNDHPEYFAMIGGKRMRGSSRLCQALCISNPKVEELIVDEMKRRFDEGFDVCQLAQQDGFAVCGCDKCRALYGTGDDWGEKFWLFHKHIAERMLKERPGKVVHILSYGKTIHPPQSFKVFPANVMVELCSYSEAAFAEWKGYTVPQGFTVYIYHWGDYVRVGFTPKRSLLECRESARRFVKNGVFGIFRCGVKFNMPGIEGPQYYMFNRTLENPDADIDATLAEFCDAAFGKEAGSPMKVFFETVDARLRVFDLAGNSFATTPGRYEEAMPDDPLEMLSYIYTADVLGTMEGAISLAERSRTATERQRKRLARVRLEFDYAKNIGLIAGLYGAYKYKPSKEYFLPLAKAIKDRNAMLDRLYRPNGWPYPLKDWPDDSQLFGYGGFPRKLIETNGRLTATIHSPLDWDVDRMLADGDYPWSPASVTRWKRYNAEHRLLPANGWRRYDGRFELFEKSENGTRVTMGSCTNGGGKVVAYIAPKGGLRPNTRYRVSWFAKAEGVSVVSGTRWGTERGFYFFINSGGGVKGKRVPSGTSFRGSFDWRHISEEVVTSEKPSENLEFLVVLLNANGLVEVEDLTIEEIRVEGRP